MKKKLEDKLIELYEKTLPSRKESLNERIDELSMDIWKDSNMRIYDAGFINGMRHMIQLFNAEEKYGYLTSDELDSFKNKEKELYGY